MNIVSGRAMSPLTELIAFISARADIAESELIGVIPGYTAFDTVRSALHLPALKPGQVLLEKLG